MSRQPAVDSSQAPDDAEVDDGDASPRAEKTPLDAGSPRRRANKSRKPAKRKVREYEEDVPPDEGDATSGGVVYEDDSPLDTIASVAQAMVEVSREGPGTGPGWVGRLYDHGDGRGPQAVYYGRIGSFPRTRQVLERVQAEAGGGYFRFATEGRPTAFETLDGAPKPSPAEQQEMLARQRLGGGGFQDDLPGFDEPRDPVQDFDPEQGIAPEDLARGQLNGWQLDGTTGRLFYYANGIRSNPPPAQKRPPVHLLAAAAAFSGNPGGFAVGAFDPESYFHGTKRESGDPEVKELLKKIAEKLVDQPREDPRLARLEAALSAKQGTDAFSAMMANQFQMANLQAQEAAKQREHELSLARIRKEAEDEERKARIAVEATNAVRMKELELAAITAKAEADKVAAQENSKAVQANAAASIASSERIATIQAQANQQVLQAVTGAANKGDQVGVLTRGLELGANLAGGKGAIGEISSAIKDVVPTLGDAYVAVKTWNGGAGAASAAGAPAQANDDDMIARFVSLLVASFHRKVDPAIMPTVIGGACIASGYEIAKLDPILKIGTPAIVGAYLQSQADKAVDEENRKKMLAAKAAIQSPEGSAWFQQVKNALAARQAPAASATVAAAPPPALPQIPAAPVKT